MIELLVNVLRRPEGMGQLELGQWDGLLRLARTTGVLSSLAVQAKEYGILGQVPEPVQPHLEAAATLAARQQRAICWEIDRIERALAELDAPVVLLKGAAYLAAGLEMAKGRLYSDVDILVPQQVLDQVKSRMLEHGWTATEKDPRDEQYYRRWMHELPPFRHPDRKTIVDVHHTILPRTDPLQVDPTLLLENSVPVDGSQLRVLAPADMVLHSAAHLIRNGNLRHGLRDLSDLDGMLRLFSRSEGFWDQLVQRARQLDLTIPCFYGLRYVQRWFGTPVPEPVELAARGWQPTWPPLTAVDRLFGRAIVPRSLDTVDRGRSVAISLLSTCWPMPRLRVMATTLFWTKRLPFLGKGI